MTSAPIELRFATPDDLPAIQAVLVQTWHRLYESLEPLSPRYHTPARLKEELESPQWQLVVAAREGEILATGSGCHRVDGTYQLERIYVVPAAQGEGIGARIFAHMLELAEGRAIRVEFDARNRAGLEFYRARGFEKIHEFSRGEGPAEHRCLVLIRSPTRALR